VNCLARASVPPTVSAGAWDGSRWVVNTRPPDREPHARRRRRHRRPRQATHAAPDCGDMLELLARCAHDGSCRCVRITTCTFRTSSRVHFRTHGATRAAAIWAARTHVGRAIRYGWRGGPVGVGSRLCKNSEGLLFREWSRSATVARLSRP
jgi:hypothetical protein